jgi:hypothetical protein
MGMQMVLLVLRSATRHPFLCREQPQRCGDESLPGESVGRKYPSIVSERLVMEVVGSGLSLRYRWHC